MDRVVDDSPPVYWHDALPSSDRRFAVGTDEGARLKHWRVVVRDQKRRQVYEIVGLVWQDIEPSNLEWSGKLLHFDQIVDGSEGRSYCVDVGRGKIVYVLPFWLVSSSRSVVADK